MPTSYTGSPTGVQAPDTIPVPGKNPTVSIPNDGESENAASVTQMVKTLADHESWLFNPRARVATLLAHWSERVMRFRSALLHTRFEVDHLGLPGGRIIRWIEDWSRGLQFTGNRATPLDFQGAVMAYDAAIKTQLTSAAALLHSAGIDATFVAACPTAAGFIDLAGTSIGIAATAMAEATGLSAWKIRTQQASGGAVSGVLFFAPDGGTINSRQRYMALAAGDTLNDFSFVYRNSPAHFDDALSFYLEWDVSLAAINMGTKLGAHLGFCEENAMPNVFSGASNNYAVFTLGTSGNWFAKTRGGGAETSTDTGIAPALGWNVFRVEFHGATVSDDGVRAVRYYINGTRVAEHTSNIPAVAAAMAPHYSCANYVGGVSGLATPVRVGRPTFTQNVYGADV